MKRRLNCLTAVQGGAMGKVAWALLGFFFGSRKHPQESGSKIPGDGIPWEGRNTSSPAASGKSHSAAAVLHQHCTPGAGYLGIPPPAAPAGCPSPDFGAECVFCCLFRVVFALSPSRNLSINQPRLSGIVDSTLKSEGGWKPSGKSPRWVCGFISSSN